MTKQEQWQAFQREHPDIADFMQRFNDHARKTYGIQKSFDGLPHIKEAPCTTSTNG